MSWKVRFVHFSMRVVRRLLSFCVFASSFLFGFEDVI